MIRFRIQTDASDVSIGWFLDDVALVPRDVPVRVASKNKSVMPRDVRLSNSYPNPFNPVTTISFFLPAKEFITLTIFNSRGQNIDVLYSGVLGEGSHSYVWNAKDRASGIYMARLTGGSFNKTIRMVLLR